MGTRSILSYVAFAAVCIFWGTTAPAIRFAVRYFPPLLLSGVRIAIAGATLLIVLIALGRATSHWRVAISRCIPGGLSLAFANSLTCIGFKTVQSGHGALLLATTALWIAVVDSLWPASAPRTSRLGWLGLLVGLAGVALLVETDASDKSSFLGAAALITSSLGWAVGAVWQSRHPSQLSPLLEAALQMLVASSVTLPVAFAIGERWQSNIPAEAWWVFSFLVITGSLIGFVCFVYILRNLPPQLVGLYTYVNPVVATWAGFWWLGEAVNARLGIATVLVLGSVAIVRVAAQRANRHVSGQNATDSTLPPLEPSA